MKPPLLIFIGIFLALYGGMHCYIYKNLLAAGYFSPWPLVLVLAFVWLAPLLTHMAARMGFNILAVTISWIGYLWMGFAFLFFSFSVLSGLWQLFIDAAGGLIGFDAARLALRGPFYSTALPACLALIASVYGLAAARRINLEHILLVSSKLNNMQASFRITQISDLHIGLMTSEAWARRLVEAVNSTGPDVIVSTGDLVDGQPDHLERFADILSGLKARYGKFAVTGNHEAFAGLERSLEFTARAGFRVLSSQSVNIHGLVNIVGVDDPIALKMENIADRPAESTLVEALPRGQVIVLLKHQPLVDKESARRFDLQLSGHVHAGQIFPFYLLTRLVYHNAMGLTRAGDHSWLYTSRGAGTWGPPMRFLAPAEITLIEFVPGNENPRGLAAGA